MNHRVNRSQRSFFTGLCVMGLFLSTTIFAVPEPNEENTHTWDDEVTIPTLLSPQDQNDPSQIQIPANIFIPLSERPESGYPAIIFISSWTLNEHEYASQARKLADSGYVVLSYTTRGFRGAPGLIDTSGPKDINDASTAITWLIDNYPVDPDAIALGGVSYGSGISLLAAAQDDRVAAVIAMSTWGSLIESLWAGQTPQETWLDILIGTATWPIGRVDPVMTAMADNMFVHQNIAETIAWGEARSPIHYMDQLNAQEHLPAIYVSNNLHDYLFQPNSIIDFLKQFNGPWRVDFNFGIHGQGEAGGLSGSDASYPWVNAKAWLDYHLKGIENNIPQLSKVNTVVLSRSKEADKVRESFDDFPITDSTNNLEFALVPQGDNTGTLSATAESIMRVDQEIDTTAYQVGSGGISGAVQSGGLRFMFDDVDPQNSLIFLGDALEEPLYYRGAATLSFWAHVEHNSQFFAYLLAYNEETGKAHWIGHSPLTWHLPEGETEVPSDPIELSMEFYWTANDIEKGERLLLVIDGKDGDYWRYADTPQTNTFVFGNDYPAQLIIPRTLAIAPFKTLDSPDGVDNARGSNGNSSSQDYEGAGGSIDWAFILIASMLLLNVLGRHRTTQ